MKILTLLLQNKMNNKRLQGQEMQNYMHSQLSVVLFGQEFGLFLTAEIGLCSLEGFLI